MIFSFGTPRSKRRSRICESRIVFPLLLRPINTLIRSWSMNGRILSRYKFRLIISIHSTSFTSFVIIIPHTFIIINLLSVYAKTILFLLLLTTGLISPSSAPGLYWYKSTLSARWHGQPDLRLPQSYIPSPGHESKSSAGACAG